MDKEWKSEGGYWEPDAHKVRMAYSGFKRAKMKKTIEKRREELRRRLEWYAYCVATKNEYKKNNAYDIR